MTTTAQPTSDHVTHPDHTLVWIDAREAVIVERHADEVTIGRIASDVPAHRKATGQVRHEPGIRHGGGGAPQTAGDPHRIEHLRRFVAGVVERIPESADVTLLGPGTVREQLERALTDADRHHRRTRTVTGEASGRLTDRQLVARLSREAGVEPRRRTVGAHRWSERPPVARSSRVSAARGHVGRGPARDIDADEEP